MADVNPTSDANSADALLSAQLSSAFGAPGAITWRRFGALRALFHCDTGPDVPVGLVSHGVTYLKAGPDTVTKYIARGMWPYRGGEVRQPLRGYWRVPPDVLADGTLLAEWAARAVDAARQFGSRPARRRAPTTMTLRP
jgi:TfoX/Sxy family transcriptional regulator of competence genes